MNGQRKSKGTVDNSYRPITKGQWIPLYVGLHPVVSLAALIAGAELFGIRGALFALPVAGVLQALLIAVWMEWRATYPKEFQRARDDSLAKAEETVAETPRDPEPAPKVLL